MRRWFFRLLLPCLLALVVPTGGWAAEPPSTATAAGLIIGLKDDPEVQVAAEEPVNHGPWASNRARTRAQWDGTTRQRRDRLQRLAREVGLPQGEVREAGNAQLLRFDRPLRGKTLDNALRRARLHPDVAWVEPDVRVPRLAVPVVPSDTLSGQQWHLQAPDFTTNFAGLNLAAAWNDTKGIADTVVAVVDSGIRFGHPDLPTVASGRMLPGYDMVTGDVFANDGNGRDGDPSDPGDWVDHADLADPDFAGCQLSLKSSWHGTFIAGQLAALTDNGLGVAGANWNARILPVRVSGKCGAWLSDLLDGLRWAAGLPVTGVPNNPHPAKVINLSFGGSTACTPGYQSTIDAVTNAGSLVVVAAGNADKALTRPADCRRVMTVASVRQDGAKAYYSSFGSRVALAAPGGSGPAGGADEILSIDNDGFTTPGNHTYGHKQGTSFAAPQAAGVASLMLAVNPFLSPRQLIDRMKAGVRDWSSVSVGGLPACGTPGVGACNCNQTTCGDGLLDAHTSVQLATGPAVVIKPMAQVEPGTVITLDGSQSVPIPGRSIVSRQWVQLSGPPVTISSANQLVATATLASEATYEFSLTLEDNFGRTGEDSVQAVAAMPPRAGGGGSVGQLWGLSLWAWVLAVLVAQRRRRHSKA